MSWAADELHRVMGGDRLATYNRRRGAGGEWDRLRHCPLRTRQRLAGARWLTLGGMAPDVAAEVICRNVGGVDDVDAAVEWYVRLALLAIAQERTEAHRRRHVRVAGADGTYYARRSRLAREQGYRSLWAYRVAKGWGENRAVRSWRVAIPTRVG